MSLPPGGIVCGALPVADCSLRATGFAQVMGDQLRLAGGHVGVALLENGRGSGVQVLSLAREQALRGSISRKSVLERVTRFGGRAADGDQLRRGKLLECSMEMKPALRANLGEQFIGELPADHRRLLCDS